MFIIVIVFVFIMCMLYMLQYANVICLIMPRSALAYLDFHMQCLG